jgi:predicted ArsR family transcriptional regulator
MRQKRAIIIKKINRHNKSRHINITDKIMPKSFTPDEEPVMLFLRKHANSTAAEIARHTGLKRRGVLRRALDGLDAKGVLRHTGDAIERH